MEGSMRGPASADANPSANMLRKESFTLMSAAGTNTTPWCLIGGDLRNRTLPE
jgi:hypothetical protein